MEVILSKHLKKTQIKNIIKLSDSYTNADEILYDLCGQLEISSTDYSQIIDDFTNEKFGWNCQLFNKLNTKKYQKDELLENPPTMKDGDIPCKKCGQKKTIIFQMQTRSADEPSTYEIRCFNQHCKAVRKTDNF